MNICDYSNYNYKKSFWRDRNRAYEDICEKRTLKRLLKKAKPSNYVLDVGCGFGRLFEVYKDFGAAFFLLDYAKNLLEEAQQTIKNDTTLFLNGDLYNIPLTKDTVDVVISVRTLHHIEDLDAFFNEVQRVLKEKGLFILEVPNKKHLLNICRFFIKKNMPNPFSLAPLKLSEVFFNYNVFAVKTLLKTHHFRIIKSLNTSFF
jgi:ubiquinone/menaquinone biosynthesis C-methylase UbiE